MPEHSSPDAASRTIVARTTRDVVAVAGPDAATYLQGQLSQDVAGLAVGEVAWSFVLAPQGKVEGWGRVARTGEETFEVVADVGAGAGWEARLRRFLLRTKADITVASGVPAVVVRGEGAAAAVAVAGDHGWRSAGWPSVDGFDLVAGGSGQGDADLDAVVAATVGAGAVEVDAAVLEAWRIRAGVPAWGTEIDAETIPATLGQWAIDASVSFTKGCYTGQELVARIDSRGGNVPRLLHALVVDGPAPVPGAAVEAAAPDGTSMAAGTVTSSAADGAGAGSAAVALVFVPRSVEVPDEGLAVTVGGTSARLRRLG